MESELNKLHLICSTMPGIKKIMVDEFTWNRIMYEARTMQRFFDDTEERPSGFFADLIKFKDVEIWKAR